MPRPFLVVAIALTAGAAHAASFRSGPLEVTQPWSRPAVMGFSGVGYMRVSNHGREAETLIGVESPIASHVEMHRSMMKDGVMSMAPAPRVAIPPGGSVTFAPGGYHLMFMDLKRNLKPGDRAPATLIFSDHRRISVSFEVTSGEAPEGH
ncbi:MAG: copper chaperone PCu(A)C [Alphaproteobacteria bacterium]|nr:copper chaperone PCu(A)C [Alphaproteobacteria bacterium]